MKKLLGFLLLMTLAAACGPKPEPEKPGPDPDGKTPVTPVPGPEKPDEEGLPQVSTFKLGETFEIPFGQQLLMPYKGFSKGDKITLTSRRDQSVRYELECTEVSDDKGALFTTPARFIGGMCDVSCPRFTGGTAFVDVVDGTIVDKVPGKTTYGRVVDWDGKPRVDTFWIDSVIFNNLYNVITENATLKLNDGDSEIAYKTALELIDDYPDMKGMHVHSHATKEDLDFADRFCASFGTQSRRPVKKKDGMSF